MRRSCQHLSQNCFTRSACTAHGPAQNFCSHVRHEASLLATCVTGGRCRLFLTDGTARAGLAGREHSAVATRAVCEPVLTDNELDACVVQPTPGAALHSMPVACAAEARLAAKAVPASLASPTVFRL